MTSLLFAAKAFRWVIPHFLLRTGAVDFYQLRVIHICAKHPFNRIQIDPETVTR